FGLAVEEVVTPDRQSRLQRVRNDLQVSDLRFDLDQFGPGTRGEPRRCRGVTMLTHLEEDGEFVQSEPEPPCGVECSAHGEGAGRVDAARTEGPGGSVEQAATFVVAQRLHVDLYLRRELATTEPVSGSDAHARFAICELARSASASSTCT